MTFENTQTFDHVSGIRPEDVGGVRTDFIQTDAAINHGIGGGPTASCCTTSGGKKSFYDLFFMVVVRGFVSFAVTAVIYAGGVHAWVRPTGRH